MGIAKDTTCLTILALSNLFGLNYKISYSIVEEKGYIEKIINSLIFEDRKIEKFFKQCLLCKF